MKKNIFCPSCYSELNNQEIESKFCDSCNYCFTDDDDEIYNDDDELEKLWAWERLDDEEIEIDPDEKFYYL